MIVVSMFALIFDTLPTFEFPPRSYSLVPSKCKFRLFLDPYNTI